MIHLPGDYCQQKLWICISFSTTFVACCTLILLVFYHNRRRFRTTRISVKVKNQDQNQNRIKENVDQQVEELIRLTPIIPFEQMKFNEFNRIIFNN
jgi:hypothetical protein